MQDNITKLASFAIIDAASKLAAALLPCTPPRGLHDMTTPSQTGSGGQHGTTRPQATTATSPIHHGRAMPHDCQVVITGLPPSGSVDTKAVINALCPAGSPQPVAFVDRNIPVVNNVIILHFASTAERHAALQAMHANTATQRALAISARNIRGGQSRQQRQHTITSREVIATATHHTITTELQHCLHTLLEKHQVSPDMHSTASEDGLAAAAEAVNNVKAAIVEVLSAKASNAQAPHSTLGDGLSVLPPSSLSSRAPALAMAQPAASEPRSLAEAAVVSPQQRLEVQAPASTVAPPSHMPTYGDLLVRQSPSEPSSLPVTYGELLARRQAGQAVQVSILSDIRTPGTQQSSQPKTAPAVLTPTSQSLAKHNPEGERQPKTASPPQALTIVLSNSAQSKQARRVITQQKAKQPQGISGDIIIRHTARRDGNDFIEKIPARASQPAASAEPVVTVTNTPARDAKRTTVPASSLATYASDVDRQLASIMPPGSIKRAPISKHVRFADERTAQPDTGPAHKHNSPAHASPDSTAAHVQSPPAAQHAERMPASPAIPVASTARATASSTTVQDEASHVSPVASTPIQRSLAVNPLQATTCEPLPRTPVPQPSEHHASSDGSAARDAPSDTATLSDQHARIRQLILDSCHHVRLLDAPQPPAHVAWACSFNYIATLTGLPTLSVDAYQNLIATMGAKQTPGPSSFANPVKLVSGNTDPSTQAAAVQRQLKRLVDAMAARVPAQGTVTTLMGPADITYATTAIALVVYTRLHQQVSFDTVQAAVGADEATQHLLQMLATQHAAMLSPPSDSPVTPVKQPPIPTTDSPASETPYHDASLVDKLQATVVSAAHLPGSSKSMQGTAPRRVRHTSHPSTASAKATAYTPATAAHIIIEHYTENARTGGPLLTAVTGAGAQVMCSMCGLIGTGTWFHQHKQEDAVVRPLMCDSTHNEPICVWNHGYIPPDLMDALSITLNGRRYSTHEAWITLAVDTLRAAKQHGHPSNAVAVFPHLADRSERSCQLWCPRIHPSWSHFSLDSAMHCNGCGETIHSQFQLQHAASTALASLAYLTTPCTNAHERNTSLPATEQQDRTVTIAAYQSGYAKRRHIADSIRNMLHILVMEEPHTWHRMDVVAMTHKLTKLAAAAIVRTDGSMRGHGLTTAAALPLDKLTMWAQTASLEVIPAETTAQMEAVMADLWHGLAARRPDASTGTHTLTICAACGHVEVVTGNACNHCTRRRRPGLLCVPNAHGCGTSCKHVSVTITSQGEEARLAGAAAWALRGGLQDANMRFERPAEPRAPAPTLFITTSPSCPVPLHEQTCVDDSVQQWEDGSHANDSNGGARAIAPVLTTVQLEAGVMCSGCGVILACQEHLEYHIAEAQVAMSTVGPLNYGIHCADARAIAMNAAIMSKLELHHDSSRRMLPVRVAHFPHNNLECLGMDPAQGTVMAQLRSTKDLPLRFAWNHLLFYFRTGSCTLLEAIRNHSSSHERQRAITATQLIWLARWHGGASSVSACAERWWNTPASTAEAQQVAPLADCTSASKTAVHPPATAPKPGPSASKTSPADAQVAATSPGQADSIQVVKPSALAMLASLQEQPASTQTTGERPASGSTPRHRRPSELPITTSSGHCSACGTVYIDVAVQVKHKRAAKPGSACASSTFIQPVMMTDSSNTLAASGDWSQAKTVAQQTFLATKRQPVPNGVESLQEAPTVKTSSARPLPCAAAAPQPTIETAKTMATESEHAHASLPAAPELSTSRPADITVVAREHTRSLAPAVSAPSTPAGLVLADRVPVAAEPTQPTAPAPAVTEGRSSAASVPHASKLDLGKSSPSHQLAASHTRSQREKGTGLTPSQHTRPAIRAARATLQGSPFTQAALHYWQKKLKVLELAHSVVACRTKAHVGGMFNLRTACQAECGAVLSSLRTRTSHHKACAECSRTPKPVYYSLPMTGTDQLQLAHNTDAHVWNLVRKVMWAEHVTQPMADKSDRIMTHNQLEACTSSEGSSTSQPSGLPAEVSSKRTVSVTEASSDEDADE